MADSVLADRYRLVRQLGEGGMGQVWEAFDQMLERPVAVKLISVLAGGGSRGDEARVRFLREARLTARLQHPNIITVHDLGEAEAEDGKTPFLVMELLRGRGLDTAIAQGHAALPDAAEWGERICAALGHAHAEHATQAKGILHRDIKPANIFLTASGAVKVLDFGIARAASPDAGDERGITLTGAIVGTPKYMPPEQARGHPEPRSDLYALGCVLFEMITGRGPFQAPDAMGYLTAHLTEPPPAPSSIVPGIPAAWDDVVLTLLRKDPSERYGSAAELAERLRGLRDGNAGPPPPPRPRGGFSPRYLRTLTAEASIGRVSFSPDSRRLAFTQYKRPALVTDLNGRQLLRLEHGTGRASVSNVAFSPDGRCLATAAFDKTLHLWNAETGRENWRTAHPEQPGLLAFSPDGAQLAGTGAKGLWLWETDTGALLLDHHKSLNWLAAAFSPDGTRLAIKKQTFIGAAYVVIVNVTDGNELLRFKARASDNILNRCLAFSPDGERLVVGGQSEAVIYEVNTGRRLLAVQHGQAVVAVTFSPHGDWLATGGADKNTRLWDSRTGAELLKITHAKQVSSVSFSPDSTLLATASRDATMQLWALTKEAQA